MTAKNTTKVFDEKLFKFITDSLKNYHIDNFDEIRHGRLPKNSIVHMKQQIWNMLFPNYVSRYYIEEVLRRTVHILANYGSKLNDVYLLLADEESKDWLVNLIAYKILGHERVKLPTNNETYSSFRKKQSLYFNTDVFMDVTFLSGKKKIFLADLSNMGFDIKLYSGGLVHIFMTQQYNYKNLVMAESGDVVLDCGACHGDTALYFANRVGETGKVFSFEFIPNNIVVFNENLALNPKLQGIVELVEAPLWEKSGSDVYFQDLGPASTVQFHEFDGHDDTMKTKSIDDFYEEKRLKEIDFIKMDIEGAEPYALRGGENTIRKHKPKLAIASYHSLDDFVNIPLWIDNLGLGYKLYLSHSTIHWEETVVFAKVD